MKHELDNGQELPEHLRETVVTEEQRYAFFEWSLEFDKSMYQAKRMAAYPPIGEFADAWVKQDEVALEAYRQACLAVKDKYPKP